MELFLRDIRYAIRSLGRARGLTATAIGTLALGIAAATTMFSVVDATLWRPLPLDAADRLTVVSVTKATAREGATRLRWSRPVIALLENATTSFSTLASFTPASISIAGSRSAIALPEQVDGEVVSPSYFALLRVDPRAGRAFTASEDVTPGGHPVVMISDDLAHSRFAGQTVLGSTLRVNDVPLTIIGVLPAGFHGLSGKANVWIPRSMAPLLTYSDYLTSPQHFILVLGRLRDGVTLAQANTELKAVGGRFADAPAPGDEPATWGAVARRLGDARVDTTARRSALALLGAAGCVLLIACVNVASLLLARARTRQREIAVRLAIGCSGPRLVRQLLTEGLVLSAAATGIGIVLALAGIIFFARTSPAVMATGRNDYAALAAFAAPTMDIRVLAFAGVLALATATAFALVPAIGASRVDLVPALREDDRTGPGRGFGGLIITEVALAVLLLVCAGLLLESFEGMQKLRAGFVTERVLTFWVRPPNARYQPADGPAIVERLLTRIEQTPGVASAAVNRCTPFAGCSRTTVFFPGRPIDQASAPVVGRHYVSPEYFRTLGIPIVAGRALRATDRAGAPAVTVINETAARRFWPGENPIGRHVWFGWAPAFQSPTRPVEIVGVVGDVKYESIDQPVNADFYTSYLQFAYPDTMIIVKARAAATDLIGSMRAAVAAVDPALPIYDVLTLDDRIDGALARPRFNAVVIASFAMAALALAAVGVYGILSYWVSSRSRELGVRAALGAEPRRIVVMVLRQGLHLVGWGVVAGVLGLARRRHRASGAGGGCQRDRSMAAGRWSAADGDCCDSRSDRARPAGVSRGSLARAPPVSPRVRAPEKDPKAGSPSDPGGDVRCVARLLELVLGAEPEPPRFRNRRHLAVLEQRIGVGRRERIEDVEPVHHEVHGVRVHLEHLVEMQIEQGLGREVDRIGNADDLALPTRVDDAIGRATELCELGIGLQLPQGPAAVHPQPGTHVELHSRDQVRARELELVLGSEGQRTIEVVDRLVQRAHPVVVPEHGALDIDVLPQRAAGHAVGPRVQERRQRLPPVRVPLVHDELQPVVVAPRLDAVEGGHVLDPRRGVVADPRDVIAVDHTVLVVIPLDDAVQAHLLAGGRRERDALVLPLLARLPVDRDVGEQVAGVFEDVGRADGQVPGNLPLHVQRDLVGELILHVVGDVERPGLVDRPGLFADRLESRPPGAPRPASPPCR